MFTTSRSITGLDSLKKNYENICENCATKEEKQKINEEILKKLSKK